MTTADVLLSAWDWEPSVVAGCLALAAGYLLAVVNAAQRPIGRWGRPSACRGHDQAFNSNIRAWQAVSFILGTLLLLLDLVSPIDALGDTYLFSAHVLQHFLLALIIPPLWLLGTPRTLASAALRNPGLRAIERRLSRPSVAWPLGVGTMLIWHVPLFFNAALAFEPLHIAQHLSFLVTGTVFWWPILSPLTERRLPALPAIAYLFSACTACSLLGAALTFSAPGAYPAYLHPEDTLGILPLIRRGWGLDAASDQQLGGMLMWVPGCLVYLSAILATVARWYATPERPVSEPA